MHSIVLYFEQAPSPELTRVDYLCDTGLRMITERGIGSGVHSYSSFRWTAGVHSLALLLVGHFTSLRTDDAEHFILSGATGSPALSLEYALAKRPLWIQDMFGVMPSGQLRLKNWLRRTNPEGKRKGPVSIALREETFSSESFHVFLDGKKLNTVSELYALYEQLELSWETKNPRTKKSSGTRTQTRRRKRVDSSILGSISRDFIFMPSLRFRTLPASEQTTCIAIVEELAKKGSLSPFALYFTCLRAIGEPIHYTEFQKSLNTLICLGGIATRSHLISLAETRFQFKQPVSNAVSARKDTELAHTLMRVSGNSVEAQFSSLIELDNFFSVLHENFFKPISKDRLVVGDVAHLWWPIKTPRVELEKIRRERPSQGMCYLRSGNSPADQWVSNAYSDIGVSSKLGSRGIRFYDMWVYGDIIAKTILPRDVGQEINAHFELASSIIDFDKNTFFQKILETRGKYKVVISHNPFEARHLRKIVKEEVGL